MVQITLSGWVSAEIWRVFLVFARVSTAFFLLPGLGEPGIPARIRMLAGLGLAIAVSSVIGPVPPPPGNAWALFFGLMPEMLTGALLGVLSRILISGVLTAGGMIGLNIGLSNIFANGLGYEQSATIGSAVYAAMLAALFAADGHHMILRSLVGSYHVVPAGHWPDIAASARVVAQTTGRSFALAAELSMPFLLLALLFNASLALINRVMPQLPVFQLGMPALVGIGLYLLAATSSAMVERALNAYADIVALVH